ncbi:MAG: hypothetical protein V4564_14210 [Pseudomonadota bacterium]
MLGLLLIAAQSTVAAPVQPATIPPIAAAAKRSVQQDFEAAAALQAADNHAGALAAWEALEKRIPTNKRSLAIIHIRKANSLYELGRSDDAVTAARAGLAELPAADATLRSDRYYGWTILARIAENALDYSGAAVAYRQAESIAPSDGDRLAVFRGLIETETFIDPDAATRDMARAEAFMAPLPLEAKNKAMLKRVKSQLLLNQGQFAAAQSEAGASVKLLGGLTAKTDLDDVASRSDYAIAALLGGKVEEARRYMAMTGAGRLNKGSFDPGTQMKVPDCGGEAGLRPEDMAVVEFYIVDDGRVVAAVPIYAAGGGAVALEFARAVRNWSFDPAQVKLMPNFFRYRARVELRCSTAFQRPAVSDYLDGDLGAWLTAKKIALPPLATGSDAVALPALRAQLAAIEAKEGGDALSLVPILHSLGKNEVVSREETNALERRALAILIANRAPATARLAVERVVWASNAADKWSSKRLAREMVPGLTMPVYADDAPARAALRLLLADLTRSFDERRAGELLKQIGDDASLPANHPLRVGALIRLASLEQSQGDVESARAAFERSGLSANQCALLDAPPKRVSVGGTFPDEARMWGFEGWTEVQFDIAADGKVLNERAVVSYPPFIFSKAGRETMAGARYEKSYRPDGGLGCGGTSQRVRFMIGQ